MSVEKTLREAAAKRILVLDGAMGTMIQEYKLDEAGYRGARFDAWNREVRGNNDLLNLSQPKAVRDIHLAYFRAGADIVSTNTFSSTSIAQADYGMQEIAYELNFEGARLVRAAAITAENEDGRKRFVAGAIGPTNRTASISPDVSNPGFRAITFDQLREAYAEQVRGLLDGGADLLLIETIFDTLNAKAAIHAILDETEARGVRVPVMISGTITDLSGRAAVRPDAGGVLEFDPPCGAVLGRAQLRARRQGNARAYRRARRASPIRWSAPIRTPACRTSSGSTTRAPNSWRSCSASSPARGLVNIVGGCCGTTPAHIRAIADAVKDKPPRQIPGHRAAAAPVGAGAVRAHDRNPVRQCRRAHQRHRLGQIPQADHGGRLQRGARDRARPGRERRAGDRRQHGRRPARVRAGDGHVPQPDRERARHRARAGDDRFIEVQRSSRPA